MLYDKIKRIGKLEEVFVEWISKNHCSDFEKIKFFEAFPNIFKFNSGNLSLIKSKFIKSINKFN